jgi:hypothetical protein
MMWNRSQRFGLPAGIAAVAVLAIGVLGSAHEAQAKAGGVFDAPSQRLETVPIEAPALGDAVEVNIPTHAPVMLAQGSTAACAASSSCSTSSRSSSCCSPWPSATRSAG